AGRSWNRSSHLSAPHRLADLFKRDLPFGLERDRLGNMRLLATCRVFGPLLWQIKPVGDRQAGMMIGRSTMSLPPGNWLACQAARNTDGARQLSGNRAWKKRRSKIQVSIGPCRFIAGTAISRTLANTARPTTAHWQQNGAF